MVDVANQARFPVCQRDAFLIPSDPGIPQADYHLFVVLTDPAKNDSVLMVNATSCHPGVPHDPTCLLQVGDHPFIRHTSYILYAKARIVSQKRLQTLIAAQTVIPRPPKISQAVFERIVAGLGGAHANPEHLAFYNANK